MSEILYSQPRRRLAYGSVPLEPWKAPHPDMPGESYYNASLNRIYDTLDQNMQVALENGELNVQENYQQIHKFCELSLTYAHNHRVNHHYENGADKILMGPTEIIKAAKDGTATPAEMLDILILNSQLGAIEIAKLTHPFDGGGDKEMMEVVSDTIKHHGGIETLDSKPHFKTKRGDETIPALVVLKKRLIAYVEAPDGLIEVLERKTFLVRADSIVADTAQIDRYQNHVKKVATCKKAMQKKGSQLDPEILASEEKIFELIEKAHRIECNDQPWLDVLTTSVYARYRK